MHGLKTNGRNIILILKLIYITLKCHKAQAFRTAYSLYKFTPHKLEQNE